MDRVLELLLDGATAMIPFFVALIVAALVLGAANRTLSRGDVGRPGKSFRRQIVMLSLTFVGVIVVVLFLPMSDGVRSDFMTLLALVISAAIALSSTTFLGNAMAGMMIRMLRHFRTGDFIRVGKHFGRVTEKELFHTEIQTEDRDLTTLPNLFLVTNPVTVFRSSGTVLSATVSLGYDVPREKIESILIEAAEQAELKDPFIEIVELGDFAVTYRIAGLLKEVKALVRARSRLRARMLDALHRGGIEIVSPTFMNQRQVGDDKRFVPPVTPRHAATKEEARPEEMIFDKADDAETLEQLRITWTEIDGRLAEIEAELEGADDAAQAELSAERSRLQGRRDGLAARIEARESKLEDERD